MSPSGWYRPGRMLWSPTGDALIATIDARLALQEQAA